VRKDTKKVAQNDVRGKVSVEVLHKKNREGGRNETKTAGAGSTDGSMSNRIPITSKRPDKGISPSRGSRR
jgi:hypothetical protein